MLGGMGCGLDGWMDGIQLQDMECHESQRMTLHMGTNSPGMPRPPLSGLLLGPIRNLVPGDRSDLRSDGKLRPLNPKSRVPSR
jgi:hypothetical protein